MDKELKKTQAIVSEVLRSIVETEAKFGEKIAKIEKTTISTHMATLSKDVVTYEDGKIRNG